MAARKAAVSRATQKANEARLDAEMRAAERARSADLQRQVNQAADDAHKITQALEEQRKRNEAQARTIQQLTDELAEARAANDALLDVGAAFAPRRALNPTGEAFARLREANRELHRKLDQRHEQASSLARAC